MRVTRLLAVSLILTCGTVSSANAVNPDDVPWDEIDRVLKETPAGTESAARPAEPGAKTETAGTRDATSEDNKIAQPDATGTTEASPAVADQPAAVTPVSPETAAPAPASSPPVSPPAPDAAQTAMHPDAPPSPQPPAVEATAPVEARAPSATPTAPAIVAIDDLLYLPVARFLDANAKKTLAGFNADDRQVLHQFYGSRMGATLWVTKQGYNADAQNLMAALKGAADWGLNPADYKVPDLKPTAEGDFNLDDLTNAELRLSLAAMEYARDARGDRIPDPPSVFGSFFDRKPQLLDRRTVIDTLASAKDKGTYLESLQPKHPQFELLRQKLIALRASAKEAEALKIPDGPKLMPGKSHPQIVLLRKRLKVSSPSVKDDGTPADDTYYDKGLASAVEAYKEKKGLEPINPAITTALRRSLNSSNDVSEMKLLANMEEWRLMPDDLGKLHVDVSIPEFMVRLVKDGEVIHEERIVSGRVDSQTPIFSDMMRTVVMQPRWNVPNSIKIKELLPGLRAGGDPLRRQGLVLEYNGRRVDTYGVDWSRTDIRNFNIYQPPGGGNALGVVKFLFPNKHSVYLHDTPSKGLFNETVRAFSHGCMRVRNPVKLAELILNEDKGWDKTMTDDLIAHGPEENEISLTRPIPVHITYFTASVGSDGEVQTFDDVYGHEKRITLALQGRWNEIAKNDERVVSPDDIPDGDSWFSANGDDDYEDDGHGHKKKKKGDFGKFLQQVFGGF